MNLCNDILGGFLPWMLPRYNTKDINIDERLDIYTKRKETYIASGFVAEGLHGTYPPILSSSWYGGVVVLSLNSGFSIVQLAFMTDDGSTKNLTIHARNITANSGIGLWKQIL